MAWSNQQHAFFNDDVDSSDGNNAKRLCVRNAAAPGLDGNWRAEIKETGASEKALRIVGKTTVARGTSEEHCGTLRSLTGSVPADRRVMFMADDDTNVTNGDADVQIGWDRVVQGAHVGNRVIIAGHRVVIGYDGVDSNVPITLNGPVVIPGAPDIHGSLLVEGTMLARNIDGKDLGTDHVLGIGRDNATSIEVAKSGVQTSVLGTLHVTEATTLTGAATMNGGATVANNLQVNGTAHMSELDLNGDGDVSGALAVHGALTAPSATISGTAQMGSLSAGSGNVTGNLVTHGNLQREGTFNAGSIVTIDTSTIAKQSSASVATMIVEHDSASATQPALDVISASDQPAIRATGTLAISALGDVEMNAHVVQLDGNKGAIRWGELGIEFLIDGEVRFYIDDTGGHNA